jgi:GT2 family glycosyltransferase/glycosyltransferase involved in cell wall biosynthesis
MFSLRSLSFAHGALTTLSLVKEAALLRNSSWFDQTWYRQTYPDLRDAKIDIARHYLEYGAKERRNPHPRFDTKFYLDRYPDVAASNMNPLVHYIKHGAKEGRIAHASVNPGAVEAVKKAFSAPVRSEVPTVQSEDIELSALPNGFQFAAYAAHNPDVHAQIGGDGLRLFEHWQKFGRKENRTPFGYPPYRSRTIGPSFWSRSNAITYFGFFDAQSGLGSAARGYRDALLEAGFLVSSVTVANEGRGFTTSPDVSNPNPQSTPAGGDKVNIFHLNADMLQNFFNADREHLLNDSFNIGIWAWELAHFRTDWASVFGALDEVWAPSEFCRAAIANISPIPVITIPHVVRVAEKGDLLPRAYFRVPENVFLFGCIFDVGSVVERKNPEAAIRAFITAFGDREDVMLLVKYHSAHHYPEEVKKLHALAAGHANVRFFGRVFGDQEIASFQAMIDCLVSPHRSEGFGLNIAEALLLGKIVISTNYSGNVDFIDEKNSYPIEYRLVELGEQLGPYPRDALWADPDFDDLVAKMRIVVDDRRGAEERGRNGRARMVRDYGAAAIGSRIKARLEELEVFAGRGKFERSWRAGVNFTSRYVNTDGPKISVVVPVFNIEPSILAMCVDSVAAQTYQNWELILHDDGSTRADTLAELRRHKGIDPRIKISFGKSNQGISEATNAAIGFSSGTFIAFLDNDDELAPIALAEMAAAILANKDVDLLYSDEDKIDSDGSYCDHYYKPDWSPEHLESVMYLLHLIVVRRETLLAIGGLRARYSGAQDYDLALRISRVARRVVHVPKILYHWRKISGSSSVQVDAKPYGLERGREALQDHLNASGDQAIVLPGLLPGLFRARRPIPAQLPVTLVIIAGNRTAHVAGRGKINIFDHFLTSILAKTKTNCSLRILAVDDGNFSQSQRSRVMRNGGEVVSYSGGRPFNFSKKVNFALKHVKTELVILLNDDMEVISADWVDSLVELAQRPTTGVVGGRLLYPDNRIQHCGIVLGINGHVAHIHHQAPADQTGYNAYSHLIRNYLAVTGACMATRMSLIDEIGGFDEAFAVDYNDVDFCLRLHASGYRNIYTPFAQLYHFEGTSLKRARPSDWEHELFSRRWRQYMTSDPFYNPNLTRQRLDFSQAP